ncbi:MAG: hypothetical protein DRM99_05685, partial [Thermoplasmata archaeon]
MSIAANAAEFINDLLHKLGINVEPYVGEIIWAVLTFIIAIVIGFIVYYIFERYLGRWAQKTKTKLDDEILKNTKKPIYLLVILIAAYYGLQGLTMLKPFSSEIAFIFN